LSPVIGNFQRKNILYIVTNIKGKKMRVKCSNML